MRVTRVFVDSPLSSGEQKTLPAAAAQHLGRVLRLGPGAALRLFNGQGGEFDAVIETVGRREMSVRVGAFVSLERESPLNITLLQGISRGEKMDLILQKATELGVTRIVPVAAARSTVRLDERTTASRHIHWQGVLASACEQSGRSRLPALESVMALDPALKAGAADLSLVLLPTAEALPLPSLLARGVPSSIALLVGPEGGFDEREVQLAREGGFRACQLGPRVLRTETAALAALAALQVLAGDWR